MFCETPAARIKVLNALVTQQLTAQVEPTAEDADKAGLQSMLMRSYFDSMSAPGNISTLLSTVEESKASGNAFQGGLATLVTHGISLLIQTAETAVLDILQGKATDTSLPAELASLREFLLRLQTNILMRGMEKPRTPAAYDPFYSYAFEYSSYLMKSWAELVDFCTKADGWPSTPAEATDPDMLDRKLKVVAVLRETMGVLLLGSLTALWSFRLSVTQACLLLPCLKSLLSSADKLSVGLPDVVVAEREAAEGNARWLVTPKNITRETVHPVPAGTTMLPVSIPGARELRLEFEDQSFSQFAAGASISVYYGGDMETLVPNGNLSNQNRTKVLKVNSDSCMIAYNSGYSSNFWGCKVQVSGIVEHEVVTLPWLVDLQRTAGLLAGKCAYNLVAPGGKKEDTSLRFNELHREETVDDLVRNFWEKKQKAMEEEENNEKEEEAQLSKLNHELNGWLTCDMLQRGLSSVRAVAQDSTWFGDTQVAALVSQLKSDASLAHCGGVVAAMEGLIHPDTASASSADTVTLDTLLDYAAQWEPAFAGVTVDSFPIPPSAADVVAAAIRTVFVTLCYHNLLVDELRQPGSSPSDDLQRAWKTAHRIKRNMRMGAQARLLAKKNEFAELVKKKKAKEEEEPEIQTKDVYQEVLEELQAKAQILLDIDPVPLPTASTTSASGHGPARGGEELSEAERAAQLTLLAYASTHADIVPFAEANKEDRVGLVWRTVLGLFFDNHAEPELVRKAFRLQRRNAILRAVGGLAYTALLHATRIQSVQREVLSHFPPALGPQLDFAAASAKSKCVVPSLMEGLDGCGNEVARLSR